MIPDPLTHWQSIQSLMRGYRQAQVLIAATQLGLFRALADGPLDAAALAHRLDADPGAVRRLANAAVAMNLLRREGQRFANAPIAETCLAREDERFYLGHLVAREGAFYDRWGHLTQAVRSGERPPENVRDEQGDSWVMDFELALLDLARAAGPLIAQRLDVHVTAAVHAADPIPATGPVRVLDVGGGHGGYSMALARHDPRVQATVFELPAAAQAARHIIAGAGMSDRVSVQVGDFQQDDLGHEQYDLVLLFGVLGSETPAGRLALMRKARAALKPGGLLAIRGFAHAASQESELATVPDLEAALFSLHLLLSTAAGDSLTLDALLQALQKAGFAQPQTLPLPDWIGATLLIARKP